MPVPPLEPWTGNRSEGSIQRAPPIERQVAADSSVGRGATGAAWRCLWGEFRLEFRPGLSSLARRRSLRAMCGW